MLTFASLSLTNLIADLTRPSPTTTRLSLPRPGSLPSSRTLPSLPSPLDPTTRSTPSQEPSPISTGRLNFSRLRSTAPSRRLQPPSLLETFSPTTRSLRRTTLPSSPTLEATPPRLPTSPTPLILPSTNNPSHTRRDLPPFDRNPPNPTPPTPAPPARTRTSLLLLL